MSAEEETVEYSEGQPGQFQVAEGAGYVTGGSHPKVCQTWGGFS